MENNWSVKTVVAKVLQCDCSHWLTVLSVSNTGTVKPGEHTFPFKFLIPGRRVEWWDEHMSFPQLVCLLLVLPSLTDMSWHVDIYPTSLMAQKQWGWDSSHHSVGLIYSVCLKQLKTLFQGRVSNLTVLDGHMNDCIFKAVLIIRVFII